MNPNSEAEDDDREQVEDPLDEHGPERPAERDRAVDLEQVGPVDVAELGRDEAVDEPRDEDDLGRVADLEPVARPADEDRPAQAAQREAEVEDDERGQQERLVRLLDVARQLVELEPGQACANRTSRTSGRTIETIVRGWRSRRAQRQLVGADLVVRGVGPVGERLEALQLAHLLDIRRGRGSRRSGTRAGRASGGSGGPGGRVVSSVIGPSQPPAPSDRDGSHPAVAARPLDELGHRRDGPCDIGCPTGHDRGGSPARRAGPPASTGRRRPRCTRPRSRALVCASDTATAGRRCPSANSAARSFPPRPMTRAFQPSTQSTRPASASSRGSLSSEPRNRSNGWGMPTSPPCVADRRDRLGGRQPGRDRALEEQADEVPVARLHLRPTMTVRPVRGGVTGPERRRRSGRGR